MISWVLNSGEVVEEHARGIDVGNYLGVDLHRLPINKKKKDKDAALCVFCQGPQRLGAQCLVVLQHVALIENEKLVLLLQLGVHAGHLIVADDGDPVLSQFPPRPVLHLVEQGCGVLQKGCDVLACQKKMPGL